MELLHLSEDDTEDSYAESLESLKESMKTVKVLFQECHERFKTFHQKMVPPIDEALLEVKPSAELWFSKRNMATTITFVEFFRAFLAEHSKEDRLDLSGRAILVNDDAAVLLKMTKNSRLSIHGLLGKLPEIFK
jgi:hypothetical protein